MENNFKGKIIAVLVLSAAILITLIFFINTKDLPVRTEETAAVTAVSATTVSTPTPIPSETPEPTIDTQADDSIIRVINAAHPLSTDYVPSDLANVNVLSTMQQGQQQLRREASEALESMFNAAMQENVYLFLIHGYISSQDLQSPDQMEHMSGLAADIGNFNRQCEMNECFVRYTSYIWLGEHSYEYGWIERYPKEKENITGIGYKPWHYRYVGVEEAQKIHESGLTMEEYYGISAQQ